MCTRGQSCRWRCKVGLISSERSLEDKLPTVRIGELQLHVLDLLLPDFCPERKREREITSAKEFIKSDPFSPRFNKESDTMVCCFSSPREIGETVKFNIQLSTQKWTFDV